MNRIKYIIPIIFVSLFLFSCENSRDIQMEIDMLNNERSNLKIDIDQLENEMTTNKAEIEYQTEKLKELNIYTSGRSPKYVIKIQLKQSHFTVDVSEHIKDAMNVAYFELPVDKEFYNSVEIGTQLTNNFRVGSLLLRGSIGNWNMTIIGKTIK